jgi:hypothetical protein
VPVNDVEAHWTQNKEGNSQISYNGSNHSGHHNLSLFTLLKLHKNPTDHYEFVSADTGYHNEISFEYLKQNNIEGLIPDRKTNT